MRAACLLLALIVLPGCDRPAPAPDDAMLPNIVWITSEDMSADVGAYGDDDAVTPNIDRLADEGIRYDNAFATAPVCSPARFTLITGIYATTAGTQGLRSRAPIPDDITGFPAYLRELGYYTTNNVKTDYNTADEQRLIEESWDESSATAHWRGREDDQPFFAVFNHMHTHQSRISFLDTEFEELEGFLGEHDPSEAPLPPYYPDEPEVRQTVARYYDAVTAMDASVGRILEQLEEDGVADNTIVFFYGDHGVGLPRGKRVLYDSGLHVPLIVHFPERWQHLAPSGPGSSTDRFVSFIDFAPTVLNLAGIQPPGYMQGEPFLGATVGEARTYVVGARDRVDEAYDVARSVRDGQYLYIRHYNPHLSWNQPEYFSDQAPIRQVITRRAEAGTLDEAQMTYAGPSRPQEALFDVAGDPHQVHNLLGTGDYEDALEEMRGRLRSWQMETRDLGFLPEGMALRLLDETPMEFADDPAVYPLERVLETASLVGDSGAASELIERLDDENGVVRYWAAIGLDVADDPASAAALDGALDDPVPEVRIAAAGSLLEMNGSERALDVLVDVLESDDSQAVLMAARTLQLLGPKSEPAHEAMGRVLERAGDESVYGIDALFIRFALNPALGTERGPTEVIEGPGRDMPPGSE
jgi:arylsulfatase A-like enzyme